MKSAVISPGSSPGKQVIEKTERTTTELPAAQNSSPSPTGTRQKKPHINAWFALLAPDERNQYSFSIYRDDKRIIIVDEQLDDRASGEMLDKIKEDELRQWPEGPFLQELTLWTQERYGGGDYHVYVVMRKGSTLMYNKGYSAAGEPKLSPREGWKPGQGPSLPTSDGALPMLVTMIRDEIKKIGEGKQDANVQVAEVTKALNDAHSAAFKWAMESVPKGPTQEQLLTQMNTMFTMVQNLLPKKEETQINPLQQIEMMFSLMQKVRQMDAPREPIAPPPQANIVEGIVEGFKTAIVPLIARPAPKGFDWGGLVEGVTRLATSPIGVALLNKIGTSTAGKGRGGVVIQRQPQGPAAPVFLNPEMAPTGMMPGMGQQANSGINALGVGPMGGQPRQPSQPQPAPADNGTIEVTEEVVTAVVTDHAKHRIVDMFQHNESGDVAAGFVVYGFPQIAGYIRFLKGPADLEGFIAGDPVLKVMIGDPRLPRFMEEFMSYFRQADAAEPEETE